MATMTPVRGGSLTADAPDREQIVAALRPWRRRLILQQIARWTLFGVILGLALACIVLLLSRLVPWATANYWAIGLSLASVLFAFGSALWYRQPFSATARSVDKRLALYDRVGTAWELSHEVSVLALLQRRDALQQLEKHSPAKTLSLRPRRSLVLLFATLVIVASLLVVLPNPMDAVLKQQATFQNTIAKQIKAIDKARQDLAHQTAIPPAQQKKLDQILRDLEAKLHSAKNNAEAQQAVAEAQAKINQLRDPQAANKAQGRAAASASLQSSNNPNLGALGQALAAGDSKQLANALKSLSSQISKLTPEQRSKLAQQIEKAANQASNNPALSKSLHQLAKSVANGTTSEVVDAANAVNAASSQDTSEQAQDAAVGQVAQSVQQAANNLSNSTDGTTNQGKQGQGQSQGASQQGQGQGQSQGTGQQGQGQGQQGQGKGQGGSGHGGSGGANGAGNNKGKNEQVSVPGQIGSGTSVQNKENGANGVVQGGSSVPYSQVIKQYNQAAHNAIDNSNVSPDMKDLVHGYFDTLEGQR